NMAHCRSSGVRPVVGGTGGVSRTAPESSRAGGRKLSGLSVKFGFGSAITGLRGDVERRVLTLYFASAAIVLIAIWRGPGLVVPEARLWRRGCDAGGGGPGAIGIPPARLC